MKTCSLCKESKPLSEFNKRTRASDGLSSWCKICKREYDNKFYRENPSRKEAVQQAQRNKCAEGAKFVRQWLISHPCIDCGLDDPELLEFDHVHGVKKAGVGRLVQTGYSIDTIKEEIDKCEVRCLHCHRKRTIKTLGWYKAFAGSNPVWGT